MTALPKTSLSLAERETLRGQDLGQGHVPQGGQDPRASPRPLLQLILERLGSCVLHLGEQAHEAQPAPEHSVSPGAGPWWGAGQEKKAKIGCLTHSHQSQKDTFVL